MPHLAETARPVDGARRPARAPLRHTGVAVTAAVAVAVVGVALNGGADALTSRHAFGIGLWWALLLGLAFGLLPLERVPRAAIATGFLLAALAALTLLSATWGESAARAVTEFNRVTVFLGVFLLGVLGASRRTAAAWSDGLAVGIVAVAVVALASRFSHGLFSLQGLDEYLPGAHVRLSFPLGYWNGVAIFVALSLPLLLRAATSARHPVARGAAVAPWPLVAAVIYFASSRGGAATAVVGLLAFLALSRRRWAALGALLVGCAAAAAAVALLVRYHELANGPLGSDAAREQGVNAALFLLALAIAAALVNGVVSAAPRVRVPSSVGWVTAGALAVGGALTILAADPRGRFADFRRNPAEVSLDQDDFVRSHLLSPGGSGRWQFWEAAFEQFRSAPLLGRGAGSYEAWWAQHGTLPAFIRDAHSLFLETLGELGLVGFVLLLAVFAVPLGAAGTRLRRFPPGRGEHLAAFTAVIVAFLTAAAIDWMWELTLVGGVGVLCLGLLAGPASLPPGSIGGMRGREEGDEAARFGLGVAAIAAGWLALVLLAMPLLSEYQLRGSRSAAAAGEAAAAFERAARARDLEPWSPAPRLQLALVQEQAGEHEAAVATIREAIERDPEDWRLWLIAARIQTKAGAVAEARRSFARARELNPRSPLFQS